jgi:hypothetical protein
MRKVGLYIIVAVLLPYAVQAQRVDSGTASPRCTHKDYQQLLNVSFTQATAADDTLLVVQVLPSFQPEYAYVFKRSNTGMYVVRARFVKQLWSQLAFFISPPKTKEQCLEQAKSAAIDTSVVLTGNAAEQMWSAFRQIDLTTDSCPRFGNGRCAEFEDGTDYVIQSPSHPTIRLREIRGMGKVKSENPILLEWIHALVRADTK